MKKTILTCVSAVLALTSCEQKKSGTELTQAPDVPAFEIPEEKPATPPEPPKPEPVPEVTPPPAKPTVGSTVWAMTRISVSTDDGILGIPLGTKLRVVRETETGYVVSDEKREFPVTSAQVSLDSNAASTAASAAYSANMAWQNSQKAAGANKAQKAMAYQALGELQTRYEQLVREEATLKAGVQRAHTEDLQAYTAANQRRVYTRTINPGQASAWRARLPIVQAEKDRIFWELKKVQP
jgi:hypothetical protein